MRIDSTLAARKELNFLESVIRSLSENGEEFSSINWRDAANIMDATIIESNNKQVVMALKNSIYHFHDNGGEINITKEVPVVDYSVPYTGVDANTLGYRLVTAIEGKSIDYDFKV